MFPVTTVNCNKSDANIPLDDASTWTDENTSLVVIKWGCEFSENLIVPEILRKYSLQPGDQNLQFPSELALPFTV